MHWPWACSSARLAPARADGASTTGDWDCTYNQLGNYGTIDGYGVAVYNNSPTNAYGPPTYTGGSGTPESNYWINSPNGYDVADTSDSGFQLGYYSTAPYSGTAAGNGAFIMQAGSFTANGNVNLGEDHQGQTAQNTFGYFYVTGGSIRIAGVTNGSLTGGGEVALVGGVLDVGNNGTYPTNGSIDADPVFQFSGGTLQNLTTATITNIGYTNDGSLGQSAVSALGASNNTTTCTGSVSNLTGNLTLNCANAGKFTGNITGSGAGTVVNSSAGMITFAPASGGTMSLLGLTSSTDNSTFQFAGTSPTSFNQIAIGSGGITMNSGAYIGVNFAGTPPTTGGTYALVTGIGSDPVGDFSLNTAGLPAGSALSVSTGTLDLVIPGSSGPVAGAWTGSGGTNTSWATTTNWSSAVPGSTTPAPFDTADFPAGLAVSADHHGHPGRHRGNAQFHHDQ